MKVTATNLSIRRALVKRITKAIAIRALSHDPMIQGEYNSDDDDAKYFSNYVRRIRNVTINRQRNNSVNKVVTTPHRMGVHRPQGDPIPLRSL
jgi:hypothetical protein